MYFSAKYLPADYFIVWLKKRVESLMADLGWQGLTRKEAINTAKKEWEEMSFVLPA